MSRVITRIRQVDGTVRVLLAQDARHADRARAILRRDPAMVECLSGVDGIRVTTRREHDMQSSPAPTP